MIDDVKKLKDDLKKMNERFNILEKEIDAEKDNSENAIAEGRTYNFTKLTNLKNELLVLIKIIDEKTVKLNQVITENEEKQKARLLKKQKKEIETYSQKTNEKVYEAFKIIINALNEPAPSILPLIGKPPYNQNYYKRIEEKINGIGFLKEILQTAFPGFEVDKSRQIFELGKFKNINGETLNEIFKKYGG